MKEQGIVTEISGDTAKVRLTQKPECTRCGLCSGAGGGFRILTSKTNRPLQVNEIVTVEINQKLLTLSSILLYGVPISGFIAGAIIGYIIGKEIVATVFAVGFFLVDLFCVKIIIKRMHIEGRIARIREDI